MCGRFNITTDPVALVDAFSVLMEHWQTAEFTPRYNISPSLPVKKGQTGIGSRLSRIPVLRIDRDGNRQMVDALWPLIPAWAKGSVPRYSTANARAETMAEKPAFRNAWKKRQRCLIVASGFYEWQKVDGQKTKQPWHIHHVEDAFMVFAGLWDVSFTADDEAVLSTTIVTTEANELMAEIHNTNRRMPVMLEKNEYDVWLEADADSAVGLIKSYRSDRMVAEPISSLLNNPGFDDPAILDSVKQ